MTYNKRNYPIAKASATKIINKFNISSPDHIDIEAIAASFNAFVKEDTIGGSSARLVKYGSLALITVNQDIREPGQKRFAIAHELGHYILHKSINQLANCTYEMFLNWYKIGKEEPESNVFAAELLMPSNIFQFACRESSVPNYDIIKKLANDFCTTLTATSFRYIDFAPYPCVLIVSKNNEVKWLHWSSDFPFKIIKRGTNLNQYSIAYDFFTSGKVPEKAELISGDAWLEDWRFGKTIILYEQCIPLPYYNVVLSLVWPENM